MAYCTPPEVRRRAAKDSATVTSLPDAEALALIEQASRYFDLVCGVEPGYFDPAYYPVWESLHVYVVGDVVTPTTRNLHKYRVTTAGTSAASEPVFPTSAASTVVSGSVTFTENGADVVASNKTIYGDGTNYLRVPPYVSGSLNTTLTLPDGYTAPTFVEKDGYLIFTSNSVVPPFFPNIYGWNSGIPIVASAIWGYAETPEDVKMAIIELVLNLWRETDPSSVKLVGLEGQPLRETMPPRVKEVARRYQLRLGVAFA